MFLQALPGPPHHGPTDGALATAPGGAPARPRLETGLVLAHRHAGKQLLHHPRGQRVPAAKRRHRRQRRFPAAGRLPHAGARHLQAPAPERELRRRRPPVMMGALRLMPAFGARQRHSLLTKQLVQRGQPLRMDPREQVLARGRHPGEHRLHQVRQPRARLILRLPSLPSRCSLRHWRLLGPGGGDRLSWSTRFSRRPGSRRYSVLKFNTDRDISGAIPMIVTGTYDPYLVILSILVASFASYTALDLGGRVATTRGLARRVWLV